jgi:hypothetical protein
MRKEKVLISEVSLYLVPDFGLLLFAVGYLYSVDVG